MISNGFLAGFKGKPMKGNAAEVAALPTPEDRCWVGAEDAPNCHRSWSAIFFTPVKNGSPPSLQAIILHYFRRTKL